MPVSALEALRRATGDSHRRLEAMPTQARLLRDDYGIAEYRRLLGRLYGFYQPLGLALQAGGAAWGSRVALRVEQLERDLRALALTPGDLHALSRCVELPPVDTSDHVLGCAYVIEGSTLGGRVIFKHLARIFPDRADVALRFFAGDGDRTAEQWRGFCAHLNAQATNVEQLCAAASATFDALAAWLAEPAPAVA
jgi:heme oxygenase